MERSKAEKPLSDQCIILTRTQDRAGILDTLRLIAPDMDLIGAGENWKEIILHGNGSTLRITTLLPEQPGDLFSQMMPALHYFFSRIKTEAVGSQRRVRNLVASCKMVVSIAASPHFDPEAHFDYISALAWQLKGLIFNGAGVVDEKGILVLDSSGNSGTPQPQLFQPSLTQFQFTPSPVTQPQVQPKPLVESPPPQKVEEPILPHPSASRVGRRMLALLAVTARGVMERDSLREEIRRELNEWVEQIGIQEELEFGEMELLKTPIGLLTAQQMADSIWRAEGVAVLAWALALLPLLPQDQVVNLDKLFETLKLFQSEAGEWTHAHRIRSPHELETLRQRMYALHWRLVEYSVRPEKIDFPRLAREAWFGPLNIAELRLLDDDLAVGDRSIEHAPTTRRYECLSAAQERHQAANWLCGYHETYSRVDFRT